MVDGLSKALERLQFRLARPESDKGAPGPADEGDVDMGEEVPNDKAPPAKKMRGFVAASKPSHAVENKLVALEPVAAGLSRGLAAGHNGVGSGVPFP